MTTAEKNVETPSQEVKDIMAAVQDAANQTQSVAYQYLDYADGSRLEIRCFPVPRTSGDLAPAPSLEVEGLYHATEDGRVFECHAVPVNWRTGEDGYAMVDRDEAGNIRYVDLQAWLLDRAHGARVARLPMPEDAPVDAVPTYAEVSVVYRWEQVDVPVSQPAALRAIDMTGVRL